MKTNIKLQEVSYDYYKDIISQDEYKLLSTISPKYARWIIDKYIKLPKIQQNRFIHDKDYEKLEQYLNQYDTLKKRHLLPDERSTNIMNFKTYDDLINFVSEIAPLDIDISDTSVTSDEYKIIYNDPQWFVVSPLTLNASKKWGSKDWCTSYPDMFDHYTKNGPLYIFIKKIQNDPNPLDSTSKWQYHKESNQFKDYRDREYPIDTFLKDVPEALKQKMANLTHDYIRWDRNKFLKSIANIVDNPDLFKKLLSLLDGESIDKAFYYMKEYVGENVVRETLSGLIIKRAVSWVAGEEVWDENFGDNGYERPWEYINEEPAYADQIPEEDRDRWWKQDADLYSDEQKEKAREKCAEIEWNYYSDEWARDFENDYLYSRSGMRDDYPEKVFNTFVEIFEYGLTREDKEKEKETLMLDFINTIEACYKEGADEEYGGYNTSIVTLINNLMG